MTHYFDKEPVSDHEIKTIHWQIDGRSFTFVTDQSVFSRYRVDFGTQRLIMSFITGTDPKNGRVLDLGCGYGVVGIVLKRLYPALTVVMTDINARAVGLARLNAEQNSVRYADVIQSDGLTDVNGTFDVVLTNPPVRAGKETVYRFFSESAERLNPGGVLYVVLQKKQGAASTQKKLEALFPDVRIVDRTAGYHVIRAQR